MKKFILSKFEAISDRVTSQKVLEEYVEFCLEHSLPERIPRIVATHHILPVAKTLPFHDYRNLKVHTWNRAILTNYHHYYAHFLLAKSVDHISTLHAFCAMHNKDSKLERITKDDLIPESEFNELYKRRNEISSQYLSEVIEVNGIYKSRASHIQSTRVLSPETKAAMSERMTGRNNIVHKPGVVEKIRKTKIDKNLDRLSAVRASQTMKQEFVNDQGITTTTYKENGKKVSKTINQKFISDAGTLTTIAKERGKLKQQQMIRDGRWFRIRNVTDDTVDFILPETLVRRISAKLSEKTEQNYLGKSKFGSNHFRKTQREYLIGLYVEELPRAPQNYNLDQDHSPYL